MGSEDSLLEPSVSDDSDSSTKSPDISEDEVGSEDSLLESCDCNCNNIGKYREEI